MCNTATPVSTSSTKKRVISSPGESSDLKNNELSLSHNSEPREDTSDISDLSVIVASMEAIIQGAEGDDTCEMKLAHTYITLAENDLKQLVKFLELVLRQE